MASTAAANARGTAPEGVTVLAIRLAIVLLAFCPRVTAQTESSDGLRDILGALEEKGFHSGKKDTADTLRQFLFGYALWCGDAEQGGYYNAVHRLATESQNGSAYASVEALLDGTDFKTTPVEDLAADIFNHLFVEEWATFSLQDFVEAFSTEGVNFFAVQNPIYGPFVTAPGESIDIDANHSYSYPSFMQNLVQNAGQVGLTFADNIGFANNFGFPSNHYDLAFQFPLLTKFNPPPLLAPLYSNCLPPDCTQPQLHRTDWKPLFEFVEGSSTPPSSFLHHVANFAFPEVARGALESIRVRVDPSYATAIGYPPYPASLPEYHTIGGEYFMQSHGFMNYLGDLLLLGDDCRKKEKDCEPPAITWPTDEANCSPLADPPCNPCELIGTVSQRYRDCLPNTDYSSKSLLHFQAWLEYRYGGDLLALASAWGLSSAAFGGCASFVNCPVINPLNFQNADGINLQQIYDDWIAFGSHQLRESQQAQYRAARVTALAQTPPREERLYTLQFGPRGVEEAALRSQGVAAGDWYYDNSTRLHLVSPIESTALHSGSFGESLNFPLFGMPRPLEQVGPGFDPLACSSTILPPDMPKTFAPACWDFEHSMRTLHELMALGVDSLALAYWENATFFSLVNGAGPGGDSSPSALSSGSSSQGLVTTQQPRNATIKNGLFAPGGSENMVEYMAEHVVVPWRAKRTFMTPWRAPILVHLGDGAFSVGPAGISGGSYGTVLSGKTVHRLNEEQIPCSPFSDREGLRDLWLTADRELLVSSFVPDLDAELVEEYVLSAADHDWSLIILTDNATITDPAAGPPYLGFSTLGPLHFADPLLDGGGRSIGYLIGWIGNPKVVVVSLNPDLPDFPGAVDSVLETLLVKLLEHRALTPSKPLRPVVARSPEFQCDPGSPMLGGIDINLMTDGLNLLCSVTNTSGAPLDVGLCVDPGMAAHLAPLINGYSVVHVNGTAAALLPQLGANDTKQEGLESVLVYGRPNFVGSILADLTLVQLSAAIDAVAATLPPASPLNNVEAFEAVLGELEFLEGQGVLTADERKAKLLAGLLRLERMPLITARLLTSTQSVRIRVEELSVTSTGATWDPVPEALVQLEWPFQNHTRRSHSVASGGFDNYQTDQSGTLVLGPQELEPFGAGQPLTPDHGAVWNFGLEIASLLAVPIGFAPESFVRPVWPGPGPHAIEVHVQHPVHRSQSRVAVLLSSP